MPSWKHKASARPAKPKNRLYHLLSVFWLVVTILLAGFSFPAYWNQGVSWVSWKTGANLSFANMPDIAYRLGLDLQGGTHLMYEADMSQIEDGNRADALQGVRDVIERRVNSFGVSEPVVQTTMTGGTYRIIVELAGVLDVGDAIAQIGETPILEFKEPNTSVDRAATTDEQATLDAANAETRTKAQGILDRALAGESFDALMTEFNGQDLPTFVKDKEENAPINDVIKNTYTKAGRVVPQIIEMGNGLFVVKYVEDAQAKRMELSHILQCFEGKTGCTKTVSALDASLTIGNLKDQATTANFAELATANSDDPGTKEAGGYLGWVEPGQTVPAFELEASQTPVGGISNVVETDFGYHIIYKKAEENVPAYHLQIIPLPLKTLNDIATPEDQWKNTGLSGSQLKRAGVAFDQNTGSPHVTLQFNTEGADLFGKLTETHVNDYIAIFLDGEAISIPRVQQAIYGGEAIITGDFTLEEAKLLAQRLNAGALPVPVNLISQQTVGPTLGQISLDKSIAAGLAGLALVALFMIALYRLPGVISVFALVLYALLNLLAYKIFGVTITLAGIAGFVLSLGMAVDANVLIFERMKEELRAGRDLRGALDEGFKRAWTSIRDGNMTTLIATAVLYGFSSSFIKGFALTLSIGVLLSMFSAITVSRTYLRSVQSMKWLRHLGFYGNVKPKN